MQDAVHKLHMPKLLPFCCHFRSFPSFDLLPPSSSSVCICLQSFLFFFTFCCLLEYLLVFQCFYICSQMEFWNISLSLKEVSLGLQENLLRKVCSLNLRMQWYTAGSWKKVAMAFDVLGRSNIRSGTTRIKSILVTNSLYAQNWM